MELDNAKVSRKYIASKDSMYSQDTLLIAAHKIETLVYMNE